MTLTLAELEAERDREQTWLANSTAWRAPLCDELLAIKSPIRNPKILGVKRNLELSILTIDRGTGVLVGTGYDLTNLRLGELMGAWGFAPVGADPARNFAGELPWFGSMKEVAQRLEDLDRRLALAQEQLTAASLTDAERVSRKRRPPNCATPTTACA